MKIKTVHIIDDELDICLLLKNYLSRKNVDVTYSTSLEDGLQKVEELKPDLLILDNNLQDGYGIDNIEKLRSNNSNLCILVISALSNLKESALENGADFFLSKPISFTKVGDLLK